MEKQNNPKYVKVDVNKLKKARGTKILTVGQLSQLSSTLEYLCEIGYDDMQLTINGDFIYTDEIAFNYLDNRIEIIGHEPKKVQEFASKELQAKVAEAIEMFYRNDN